ncbi:glycosyltransferase family 4 protein [Paraburkholderia hospita]|jgi:glycosyltransferase involved in cell wall biosynthesis|uniref:glycosyltransferase family 4 protein n=1 Tax=Paraburkholderia hospita TaxID=169430 RepID=UPI0009A72F50|nr:glycosyltransferase family 4 protein [Paraburkholderia hospita]SKD04787.1 Glycosyltransferase involved in cell wall bisynthesis [Paraburkholderia hospita]
MRVAQIAPLHEAVPPALYGGTERVVSYLTEALVDLGHDVTLFASGDSHTRAQLEAAWPHSLRLDPSISDPLAPHLAMLEHVRRRAHEFDILHFHLSYLPFPVFSQLGTPFLTTLHGRLDLPELRPVFDLFPQAPLVSISDSQRAPIPDANWLDTVHHGVPADLLTPQPHIQPTYLAFLGRICPEKRADLAIEIAGRAGLPLKIAAKVDKADEAYFRSVIEPLLAQPHVDFLGEINEAEKPGFLSGALALLFPIDWPEPFGLAMIEAMACGTPVIAFNRGSVQEVVEQGVTGYIVDDVAGAARAAAQLDVLSRSDVRARFVHRFTSRTMALNYVDIYTGLSTARRPQLLRAVAGRRDHDGTLGP